MTVVVVEVIMVVVMVAVGMGRVWWSVNVMEVMIVVAVERMMIVEGW